MNQHDYVSLLSEMEYRVDKRNPPDNNRKGQFRTGWERFTIRGHSYTERSLMNLTWNNLGHRLANRLGHKTPDEINDIYEHFAHHYEETH